MADMHTVQIRGWKIHHNSDWSGTARIASPDGSELRIPAPLFLAAAASMADNDALSNAMWETADAAMPRGGHHFASCTRPDSELCGEHPDCICGP